MRIFEPKKTEALKLKDQGSQVLGVEVLGAFRPVVHAYKSHLCLLMRRVSVRLFGSLCKSWSTLLRKTKQKVSLSG